ncbi:MAG: hypothetical protein ABIP94_04505, partial [Planctomycetota bacterium]
TNLLLGLLASVSFTGATTAQIFYVDANPLTNTTLADGSAFVPNPASSGNDNNWTERAVFANGGSAFESNSPNTPGGEDAPMLRTRISGLVPGASYLINAYFWGAALTITWRGRAVVDTVQPAPPLQGWNAIQPTTSAFIPMTALGTGAQIGPLQPALNLAYDAAGFEIEGHFATPVLVQEGNRWLTEAPLGVHVANAFGEINVYIDDLEFQSANNNRTWYDGVGFEAAPQAFGNACGTVLPQIGWAGAPIMAQNLSCTLSSAPAGSLAVLAVGLTPLAGPVPLAVLGAPNCDLNITPDVLVVWVTDATGNAAQPLSLSGPPSHDVYWQWVVFGPTELVVTKGLLTRFHR